MKKIGIDFMCTIILIFSLGLNVYLYHKSEQNAIKYQSAQEELSDVNSIKEELINTVTENNKQIDKLNEELKTCQTKLKN